MNNMKTISRIGGLVLSKDCTNKAWARGPIGLIEYNGVRLACGQWKYISKKWAGIALDICSAR